MIEDLVDGLPEKWLYEWELEKGAAIRRAYTDRKYTDLKGREWALGLDGWFWFDEPNNMRHLVYRDQMTAVIAVEYEHRRIC